MIQLTLMPDGRKAIIVRTSDRQAFKQCRRRWGWSSHLKANLGSKNLAAPLWFGSAIHYALEDYWGYNVFGHPTNAFVAYCIATSKQYLRDLPPEANDLVVLGKAMMDYYVDYWLKEYPRTELPTYWAPDPISGEPVPQVEVNFQIPIPLEEFPRLKELAGYWGADCILYCGTIDKMVIEDGLLWVEEYKTAKVAAHLHYQTDAQVTTYVWAAKQIYSLPVVGVIYKQFVKKIPTGPKILTSGKVSTSQTMVTSYPLYKKVLDNLYGDWEFAPHQNRDYMANLMASETEERDRYIQRERVERNDLQCEAEAEKIILELEDMLNPDLNLYPNPTRDCPWMCPFLSACVSMDDGSDWEDELRLNFTERDQAPDRMWRNRLPAPTALAEVLDRTDSLPDLTGLQDHHRTAAEREQARLASAEAAGYGDATTDYDGLKDDNPVDTERPFAFDMSEVTP